MFANLKDQKSPMYLCQAMGKSALYPASSRFLFAFLLFALACSPKVPHPGLLKLSLSMSLKERTDFQSEQQNQGSELNQAPSVELLYKLRKMYLCYGHATYPDRSD